MNDTIYKIIGSLKYTLKENIDMCCGLASPQIGYDKRIFVMRNEYPKCQPYVFINPRIIKSSGRITSIEQCMSIANVEKKITRKACITVAYKDENFMDITKSFTNENAICIQHEMDHLIGKLIIDYK